jgi:hypothetical protein
LRFRNWAGVRTLADGEGILGRVVTVLEEQLTAWRLPAELAAEIERW